MEENERQLEHLEISIQLHPHAPVNYLLRGEYWLASGDLDRAQEDLLLARRLAKDEIHASDWGYILQSYLDRTEEMLLWIGQQDR